MAQVQEDPSTNMRKIKNKFPLDANAYKLLSRIGVGVSATVYKAVCLPMNSAIVAIKAIDLDQSRADFDSVRRETKTMILLSHPNILNAYCSFTVGRCLWVVMPFMSCGSLHSIVSSSFPDGLPENCISVFLREILNAIAYLHDQGHLHRDIKAGNILVDSDGSVKLADFGVSASIYEPMATSGVLSSSLRLTDVAGTPYWMAPEVVHSHTGYGFKADIWSFGITALELAHGRPPLSDLPPFKSLLMKITKRFHFSDYEINCSSSSRGKKGNKKFSKAFREMVGLCLEQDPAKRPPAEKLLRNSFFKNCKRVDFLVKNVLRGLSTVEEWLIESKIPIKNTSPYEEDEEDDDNNKIIVKNRRISGWNFCLDDLQLSPVFPENNEPSSPITASPKEDSECHISTDVKEERHNKATKELESDAQIAGFNITVTPTESHFGSSNQDEECTNTRTPEEIVSNEADDPSTLRVVGFERKLVLEKLMLLKTSLDHQRARVSLIIETLGGEVAAREEMNREEQLLLMVEKLKIELETEKRKNLRADKERNLGLN